MARQRRFCTRHKPHIGTDVLSRGKEHPEAILSYGGEVRFLTQVMDILSEPAGEAAALPPCRSMIMQPGRRYH